MARPDGWPQPVLAACSRAAVPDATVCPLPAQRRSVKIAREFTKSTLQWWSLQEFLDDMALVVSELVTNALQYGLPQPNTVDGDTTGAHRCAMDGSGQGMPIRLYLERKSDSLVCSVSDPSDRAPELKEPDYVAETGRGLHLIDCISGSWGWSPVSPRGKAVWATFPMGLPALMPW